MVGARPGFLLYELAVAAACLVAVPVALAPVMPWGRRLPRRVVGVLAWSGTALTFPAVAIWELWFYLGAVLFGISTWRFWRPTRA